MGRDPVVRSSSGLKPLCRRATILLALLVLGVRRVSGLLLVAVSFLVQKSAGFIVLTTVLLSLHHRFSVWLYVIGHGYRAVATRYEHTYIVAVEKNLLQFRDAVAALGVDLRYIL